MAKRLETYLTENQVPWVNLFQQGAGWKHPMAVKYGVRAIPNAILVAFDGNVVLLNARGIKLAQQLEGILGPAKVDESWQTIVDSLKQRLQEEPDDQSLLNELAINQSRAEQWTDCADIFRKLYTRKGNRSEDALALAAASILAKDLDGYQTLCHDFEMGIDWNADGAAQSDRPAPFAFPVQVHQPTVNWSSLLCSVHASVTITAGGKCIERRLACARRAVPSTRRNVL